MRSNTPRLTKNEKTYIKITFIKKAPIFNEIGAFLSFIGNKKNQELFPVVPEYADSVTADNNAGQFMVSPFNFEKPYG